MHILKPSAVLAVALIALALIFLAGVVSGWTGPGSSPPSGNVSAPVNVGTTDQVKDAALGVDGLAVFGNSLLQAASYLNWGSVSGSGGYGIRDNAGTLEFKNSGGAWSSLQALGFSSWTTSGNDIYNANSGNAGIGTGSPGAKLHVAGGPGADTEMRIESPDSSKAAFVRVRTTGGQGEFAYGGPSYGSWGGANSLNIINANGYGPITLNHFLNGGPIEHMRLDYAGNVAIGTSGMANYIGWPGSLNVNGQVKGARFYDDDPSYYIDINSSANVGGSWTFRGPVYLAYEEYNDGEWYLCHHGGHVVLGHFCSASDERLKTNLEPITGVLEQLDNYRTVTFDWKDPERGTERQIGVIAQDFENDYPELVSADKETGYLYFDYQRLSAVLLEGEKELKARVDAQQKEIDELRKEIEALKER